MTTTFWQNRKVFMTGHTGFKGSWLSLWLQLLGADLVGFSLSAPTEPNLFTLANVASGMKSVMGDIRDFALLQKALQDFQPEIIIHMAAQPLVRYSYEEPIETYATNVLGTVHVLEAARKLKSVKAILNVTTDKCYENKEWQKAYHENDILGGYDPYSNSKACAELVTSCYRTAFLNELSVGLASARAGNVIGGGDWAKDRLIPDIVRAFMNKKPINIRYPNALRPWQHVLEPLSGYLSLTEKLYQTPETYSSGWNFGPEEKDIQPVSWIADTLVRYWQQGAAWQLDNNAHPHEATYLKLDCRKANNLLGWFPRWGLARALKETVAWYQAYLAKENIREKTFTQIKNFMSDVPLATATIN